MNFPFNILFGVKRKVYAPKKKGKERMKE